MSVVHLILSGGSLKKRRRKKRPKKKFIDDGETITVYLRRAKGNGKKFTCKVGNKTFHFGQAGASDFTKHKNYSRMAAYVQRHHGIKFENIDNNKSWFKRIKEQDDNTIKKELLQITKSRREKWDRSGIATAGFWSRWLLWSHPDIEDAKRYIQKTFNVSIHQW